MPDKAKTLLFSVLLLPATAMATTGNAEQQNTQQIRIEQIQEETALYEAMLAREKIRHELRTLEQGARRGRTSAGKHFRSHNKYTGITIPRLTAIFGVQPQLTARIELPGKHLRCEGGPEHPRNHLSRGKITPDSVVLEQSGTRKTLRP
ncbi:type IV pilus biogenesis protein PilP [Escherichia coli]|nr:type IV pilus biogenesis protein PilP [Escherichia coli]